LSRNPPFAVVIPLFKELYIDPSSEELLFSFPHEQQSLLQNSTEANIITTTSPRLLTPEHTTLLEILEPIIEEFDESNNEPYLSLDSSSEEDENDSFLSDFIPIGQNDKYTFKYY